MIIKSNEVDNEKIKQIYQEKIRKRKLAIMSSGKKYNFILGKDGEIQDLWLDIDDYSIIVNIQSAYSKKEKTVQELADKYYCSKVKIAQYLGMSESLFNKRKQRRKS